MNALRSELKEGGGASGKDDMSISDLLRAKNLRKQVLPARRRGGEVGRGGWAGEMAGERRRAEPRRLGPTAALPCHPPTRPLQLRACPSSLAGGGGGAAATCTPAAHCRRLPCR